MLSYVTSRNYYVLSSLKPYSNSICAFMFENGFSSTFALATKSYAQRHLCMNNHLKVRVVLVKLI